MEAKGEKTLPDSPASSATAKAAAEPLSTGGALLTQRGYWRRWHENATHQPSASQTAVTELGTPSPSRSPENENEASKAVDKTSLDAAGAAVGGASSVVPAAAACPVVGADEGSCGEEEDECEPIGSQSASPACRSASVSSAASASSTSSSESSGIPTTGSRFDILMQSNSGAQGGSSVGDRDSYRSVVRKATRACHQPQDRSKGSHDTSAESKAQRGGHAHSAADKTNNVSSTDGLGRAVVAPVGEPIAIPTKAPFKKLQAQPFSHILVCDFEATCESGSVHFPHEIIEFPVVVLDTATLRVVAEFHEYVRPVKHPKLTHFCTELTGITQATVDAADPLPVVVQHFQSWLETVVYPLCRAWREAHDPSPDTSALSTNLRSEQRRFVFDDSSEITKSNIREEKMICFATDGPWDMRRFMHECSVLRDGIEFPPVFYRYINVRHAYGELFKGKQVKLTHMLKRMGMSFEGQRHSGICDTRNIARVLAEVMARGYRVHHVSIIKYAHRGDRFLEHNQLARELLAEEEQEKLAQKLKGKQRKSAHTCPASADKAGRTGTQRAKAALRNAMRRSKNNK